MTAGPTAALADETGILQRGQRRELGGNPKRRAEQQPGDDDAQREPAPGERAPVPTLHESAQQVRETQGRAVQQPRLR